MRQPRTGGRGAPHAPVSEPLAEAAEPGRAAPGGSAVQGYPRGAYPPSPRSLCRTPGLGDSRLARAGAGTRSL